MPRVGEHGVRGAVFAAGAEAQVDPGVIEVGDEHVAAWVDGDADGEVELSGPGPPAAPLQEEAGRGGGWLRRRGPGA